MTISDDHSYTIADFGCDTIKIGTNLDEKCQIFENCLEPFSRPKQLEKNSIFSSLSQYLTPNLDINFSNLQKIYNSEFSILNNYDRTVEVNFEKYLSPRDGSKLRQKLPNNLFLLQNPHHAKNPKIQTKTYEKIFEEFNFENFFTEINAATSLFSTGKITGTSLDSGHSQTHVISIFDGFKIYNSLKFNLTNHGSNGSKFLMDLLSENLQERCSIKQNWMNLGNFPSYTQLSKASQNLTNRQILNQIKQRFCYCAYDFDQEFYALPETFTLPDDSEIILENEKFQPSELNFNSPFESTNFQDLIFDQINQQNLDLKNSLYSNIVISGGNTQYKFLQHRLEREMTDLWLKEMSKNYSQNLGQRWSVGHFTNLTV